MMWNFSQVCILLNMLQPMVLESWRFELFEILLFIHLVYLGMAMSYFSARNKNETLHDNHVDVADIELTKTEKIFYLNENDYRMSIGFKI